MQKQMVETAAVTLLVEMVPERRERPAWKLPLATKLQRIAQRQAQYSVIEEGPGTRW